MRTSAGAKKNIKAGLLLLALSATAAAQQELSRAREAAALGSETRALDIAMQGLKQAPGNRELFLYAMELLPETPSRHAAALAAAARARLEKESDDYAWYLGLCKTQRVAGRATQALANCRKALELEPILYPTYREMGLTYAAAGNWAKAAETLGQGIEISPSSYQAHYHLARALENSGNSPGSRRSYLLALKLAGTAGSPDSRYYHALITAGLKRLDRGILEARSAAPEPPGKERLYTACLEKFRDEVRKDNLLNAADLSADCLKILPADPRLAAELAPVLVRLGKYEAGVKEYERAAVLNGPDKTMAAFLHVKAAELRLRLGEPQKAIAQYQLAAAANPADMNTRMSLAETLDARSDFKAALEAYEAILKNDPANTRARTRVEELKTDLMTSEQIMEELKLRRIIEENKAVLQPEDINLFKAVRAAEISGAVDYVRERVHSVKGLYLERQTPHGVKVLLTGAGYRTYTFHATRDAIVFFERQKIGLRELFKLRDLAGELIFDPSGRITQAGAAAWVKARTGTKTWLLPYEAVAESPKAIQANKDIAAAQKKGYREISEPEYLWLLRATNCPEKVLQDKPLSMQLISDGARVRYMMCCVRVSDCMNSVNEKLPSYMEAYRNGDTALSDSNTSTAFFGTGGVKKYRFCENGKLWNSP